ncbi:MAG: ABC transporter substrate-binding protein [Deltaproteobacteria bacterium]|nr:ABC transporter substrate-binding protein [Deltaproteobacteria bacterium]
MIWLSIICLIALAGNAPGAEKIQSESITLKVHLMSYLSNAPFYIADKEGYFNDQGLNIEFIKIESKDAMAMLIVGKIDVYTGTLNVGLLNAIAKGADVKLVSDKFRVGLSGCSYTALVARRELVESGKLERGAAFKGLRIAANRNSPDGYWVEKTLSQFGITLDDLRIIDTPAPAQPEALARGMIDAAVLGEPWLTRTIQAGQGVLWISANDVIPGFQYGFVAFGPSILSNNREAGKRFMLAYLKGVRQFNEGKTERNLVILEKPTNLSRDFLKHACWPVFSDNGQINVQSVLDFQKWAMKKGLIDKELDTEQFWDPFFIEHANKTLLNQ